MGETYGLDVLGVHSPAALPLIAVSPAQQQSSAHLVQTSAKGKGTNCYSELISAGCWSRKSQVNDTMECHATGRTGRLFPFSPKDPPRDMQCREPGAPFHSANVSSASLRNWWTCLGPKEKKKKKKDNWLSPKSRTFLGLHKLWTLRCHREETIEERFGGQIWGFLQMLLLPQSNSFIKK